MLLPLLANVLLGCPEPVVRQQALALLSVSPAHGTLDVPEDAPAELDEQGLELDCQAAEGLCG